MLEKLRQIENRYAELESKLADPAYYSDPAVFTKLCREQRELQPVVEAYRAYTACQAQIAQAEALLGDRSCTRSRARRSSRTGPAARSSSSSCVSCCCRVTRMTTATSFWRSAPVSAEKNRRSLRIRFIGCTTCTPTRTGGRPRSRTSTRRSSAACARPSLLISGQGAYSRLKFESGVHRVQRVPGDGDRRTHPHQYRHRGRAAGDGRRGGVHRPQRICRSTPTAAPGAGGQHVNKTESAIRHHAPADRHGRRVPG